METIPYQNKVIRSSRLKVGGLIALVGLFVTVSLIAQIEKTRNVNDMAIAAMRDRNLIAVTLVQEVDTGNGVASTSSHPETLSDTTPILPLSFMKVFLAASWWEHRQPEKAFDCKQKTGMRRISIHEMLVNGCDLPGKQMAVSLRRAIGGATMLADLQRFGVTTTLRADASDAEWGDTWSLGERDVTVTERQISSFLIGVAQRHLVRNETAAKLEAAMRQAVRSGTAKGSDAALDGTGWTIGGKTGSGGVPEGEPLNGLFAGLIFDIKGIPHFTVTTFVEHGGYGGGNAATLSAQVARELAIGH